MEVKYIDPKELHPFPSNPKRHPESQISKLVKSLEQFDFTRPIPFIEHEGKKLVLAGHGVIEAALEKGVDKVPAVKLDLTYEKARAYVIADNKLAELSEWDDAALAGFFKKGFPAKLLDATGLTEEEVRRLVGVDEVLEAAIAEREIAVAEMVLANKCPRCGYRW